MARYYEYVHHAGYGRDDHMADELIARAARQLGLATGSRIAQACGLASHSVPMGSCTVRMPAERGTAARMRAALRRARSELRGYVDCSISVDCLRVVVVRAGESHAGCLYTEASRLVERRDRRGWRVLSMDVV